MRKRLAFKAGKKTCAQSGCVREHVMSGKLPGAEVMDRSVASMCQANEAGLVLKIIGSC